MDESLNLEFHYFLTGKNLSQSTIHNTHIYVKHLLYASPSFEETIVKRFFAEKLMCGNSPASINKYIQATKLYCEFKGLSWGEGIKRLKEKPGPKSTLSEQEVESFLSLPQEDFETDSHYLKYQLFWALIIWTGSRTGEVRTLTVEQVDFGRSMVIYPKTKSRPREVPLVDPLIQPLKNHISTLESHYLFPSQNDLNKPMVEGSYRKDFKRRLDKLGIKRRITSYNLRHTAITRWLKKLKINIFEVKRLAGHSRTSTTEQYYELGDMDELRNELNQDPLIRKKLDPQALISQVISAIDQFKLERDDRFDLRTIEKVKTYLWASIKTT